MLDPVLSPWDLTALPPIVEEAGGVFTDWSGVRTIRGESGVSTNRGLAEELRAILKGPLPPLPSSGVRAEGDEETKKS